MKPALDLGQAILRSMKHVEGTLLFVFERTANAFGPQKIEAANQILHQLDVAREAARKELADLFRQVNEGSTKIDISSEASNYSRFFVSLIEVGNYMFIVPAGAVKSLSRWLKKCTMRLSSLIGFFCFTIPPALACGTLAFPWRGWALLLPPLSMILTRYPMTATRNASRLNIT